VVFRSHHERDFLLDLGFVITWPGPYRVGRFTASGSGVTRAKHGAAGSATPSSDGLVKAGLEALRWAQTSMAPRRTAAAVCNIPSRRLDAPAPRPPGPAAREVGEQRRWTWPCYAVDRLRPPGPWKIPLWLERPGTRSGAELAGPVRLQTPFVAMGTPDGGGSDHHRLHYEREEWAPVSTAVRVRMAAVLAYVAWSQPAGRQRAGRSLGLAAAAGGGGAWKWTACRPFPELYLVAAEAIEANGSSRAARPRIANANRSPPLDAEPSPWPG